MIRRSVNTYSVVSQRRNGRTAHSTRMRMPAASTIQRIAVPPNIWLSIQKYSQVMPNTVASRTTIGTNSARQCGLVSNWIFSSGASSFWG